MKRSENDQSEKETCFGVIAADMAFLWGVRAQVGTGHYFGGRRGHKGDVHVDLARWISLAVDRRRFVFAGELGVKLGIPVPGDRARLQRVDVVVDLDEDGGFAKDVV